jgi:hypothetical protein
MTVILGETNCSYVFGGIRILVVSRPCPEGRCDRSLARSAWESRHPEEAISRVRCEAISQEEAIHDDGKYLGIAAPGSYRTLRDGAFEGQYPRHFVPGYDRVVPPGEDVL